MSTAYQNYLGSEHWKRTRRRYIRRQVRNRRRYHGNGIPRCKICCCYGLLDIHHTTYRHIGAERIGELMGLCRGCHDLVHELMQIGVGEPKGLPKKLKIARKEWWAEANRKGYWRLRRRNPAQFKQLANDFLRENL